MYLQEDVIEHVDKISDEQDISFSEAVRRGIRFAMLADTQSPFAEERLEELRQRRDEIQDSVERLDETVSAFEDRI